MSERIVINTSPLVALFKAEALDVAGQLPFEFIRPPQVREELDAGTMLGLGAGDGFTRTLFGESSILRESSELRSAIRRREFA